MSKTEKLNEEQVFKQEIDDDELETVSGGKGDRFVDNFLPDWAIKDDDPDHCIDTWQRGIYEGGFPNCAATVENESWCEANDACEKIAIDYQGMSSCKRSWK